MATFDGNGYTPPGVLNITAQEPEGVYSTTRFPDGMVETILFRNDGTTVGPVRNYQGISEIQREHIRKIQTEIVKGA